MNLSTNFFLNKKKEARLNIKQVAIYPRVRTTLILNATEGNVELNAYSGILCKMMINSAANINMKRPPKILMNNSLNQRIGAPGTRNPRHHISLTNSNMANLTYLKQLLIS